MKTKIIEVEEPRPGFYGKFMIGRFEEEWTRVALISDPDDPARSLLRKLGWIYEHFLVVDLSVGHGAIFHSKSNPEWDVPEKGIYFCPMFIPFMNWLKTQDLTKLDELPEHVVLDGPLSSLGKESDRVEEL